RQLFGSLFKDQTETNTTPVAGPERIDQFGLYHVAPDSVFKNAHAVGDWVLPGLGIESDALTAWQAANTVTKAASSFWKSGPKR
ncbi:MAG: hypothetical protein ACPGQS_08635, partial [Bradymonadia bacterium]